MSWIAEAMPFVNRVMKLKAKMIERGLKQARAKCLCDGGEIRASIAGRKPHIHAHCDKCKQRVME
jgi:hypothetical protein